jgi:hypothetical protein
MGFGNHKGRGRRGDRGRGMALALVIGVMFIFLALGTGTLFCGFQNRVRAVRDGEQVLAKAAADAGLRRAISRMHDYESGSLPSATDEALPGAAASYSFTVQEDAGGGYAIRSTGTSATATRTVQCRVRRVSQLWSGAAVSGSVAMTASSQILPLTPDDSLVVRTASVAPRMVSLKSGSTVDGDIIVGTGGDPDSVVSAGGQSAITGTQTTAPVELEFPPVTPPTGLTDYGAVNITSSQVISSNGQYASLLIDGGISVEIDGDITLYIVGSTTLRNAAEILVRDGSRLTLYLGGSLTLKNAAIKEACLRPERVHIYGTPTCTEITCTSSSDIYAAIYAPAADCTLNSSSQLVGSFAGKSLTLGDASTLYYTESVGDGCPYGPYTYRISRWWED